MNPMMWSLLLLTLAGILLILELMIPSGGILGGLAALATIAAVVLAFRAGPLQGSLTLLGIAVLGPMLLVGALKLWPKTPFGKQIFLAQPKEEEVLPRARQNLQDLIGKRGTARSALLLSGSVNIDGSTYDAISDGMPIETGQPIQVIAIRMKKIVVRPTAANPAPGTHELEASPGTLEQPIEELGLEPLDDPLA